MGFENSINAYIKKNTFGCKCSRAEILEMQNPPEDYPIDWGAKGPNVQNYTPNNSVWNNPNINNPLDSTDTYNPSANTQGSTDNNSTNIYNDPGFIQWLKQNRINIPNIPISSTQSPTSATAVSNVMAETLKQHGYSSKQGSAIAKSALGVIQQGNVPTHYCYRAVKNALKPFGKNLTGGSAYMAADQLAKDPAFKEITGVSREDLRKLPAGAVVVYDKIPNYTGKNSACNHGHISIALGDGREASYQTRAQVKTFNDRSQGKVYYPKFRVFIPLAKQ